MRQIVLALAFSAVVAFSGSGCSSAAISPSDVAVGQEFTLAPGDSVFVAEGGLRVSFDRVVEDSRCPSDVACISAGQVAIEVTAGTGRGSKYQLHLNEAVSLGAFRLRLVRVAPYPSAGALVEPSLYRATFLVERA